MSPIHPAVEPRHGSQQATVSLHALSAGHFTLPEYQFIHPVSTEARKSVPSLAFLLQHRNRDTGKLTRVVFDLGLRKDVKRYAAPIQKHIETRQPMTTRPDVMESLAKGGLQAKDIDFVIFSHVHWDHIGDPRDFPESTFVVGHGSLALLNRSSSSLRGGHSFFEHDLLPGDRTVELPDTAVPNAQKENNVAGDIDFERPWRVVGSLPQSMDIFGDGSLLIVNAPGHLPGHINILARVTDDHQIYMAGDACHDRRLLTGEKSIGEWDDADGHTCCIHANRSEAEATIERIKQLEKQGVEIIFAHDFEWENEPSNEGRFFGAAQ